MAVQLERETITASRLKLALYWLASLAFVAIGVMMVLDPEHSGRDLFFGWLSIAFFGLGLAVFSWTVVRPQTIVLEPHGFTIAGGLSRKPKTTAWRDIEPFFVFRLPRGGRMIGFNYAPHAGKTGAMIRLSRMTGAEGGLPKGFPGSLEAMAERLNAYRVAALAGPHFPRP